MATSTIVYNSVDWNTSFDFTLSENGVVGADNLPEPRDDGYLWIPGTNVPVTEATDYGINQIVINGVISKSTNTGLLNAIVSLKSSLRILREANVFKTLYFSDYSDIEWAALPGPVNITYFGPRSTATKARVTVVFDAQAEYQDVP